MGAGGWPGPGLGSSVSSVPRSLCTGPPGLSVASGAAHQGCEGWANWTGQRGTMTLPLNPGFTMGAPDTRMCTLRSRPACVYVHVHWVVRVAFAST